MAISVDWPTKVITVPKADTQLVSAGPPEIRQLDVDQFRLSLKALEADVDGMTFLHTHNHNQPVTIGGVTLARVVEIINGYTVTFEDGAYAVNLVGANQNIGDVLNFNQVQVRSSNSAGLTFSDAIISQSFTDNKVYINTMTGLPGTQFPRGTPTDPVSNFADAKTIADARKFTSYELHHMITLGSGDAVNATTWSGHAVNHAKITFSAGVNTADMSIHNMRVLGAFDGDDITLTDCWVGASTGFCGTMIRCAFEGNVTMNGACTDALVLDSCRSQIAGSAKPVVDINSANVDVNIRNYVGGIEVRNFNNAGKNMSIDFVSGSLTIHSSCTDGTILVRSADSVDDQSGAGCTVVVLGNDEIAEQTAEGTLSVQQAILAATAGKADGFTGSAGEIHFRDQADGKNRITATVDQFGNRTSITLDLAD
ncbi:MAG: hypothetical protein OEL78_00515 [Hyphomicrobiales bacterium]|nr:hypothetical protein [Hyphomicrobiales bacterium]